MTRSEIIAIQSELGVKADGIWITWASGGERNRLCQTLTETGDEAHAVVRRAIVRAAAKIVGKVK